ncbi:acetyl-CoA C-acyltransferase [Microbacterium sp. GXF7504]
MTEHAVDDAFIVSYARTPIARAFKGSLVGVRPDDLLTAAAGAALERAGDLPVDAIEDFIAGCAVPQEEQGQNIARRVSVMLGHDGLPGVTVNRFCASSIQAARMGFHGIRAGEGQAYLIGGVESTTRISHRDEFVHPLFSDPAGRTSRLAASDQDWSDPRQRGEVPDYYVAMGITAEFVARHHDVSRADQDAWALRSQQRAAAAALDGYFAEEVTPVSGADGQLLDQDESPRAGTTLDALAGLTPVFSEHGTVTAGNACPLNDGASALLLASGRAVDEYGLAPQARVVASAVSGLSPEIMQLGPVEASRRALDRAGLTINDIDIVEMNEAFAAQVVPSMRMLEIDPDKLNPFGGAIALGHPFGATGARLLGTLAHGLKVKDGRFGLATLCVGGGQGMAVIIERVV